MKTSKITISLLILFAAGLFTFSGNSQSTIDINTLSSVSVKTADYPEWIKMMRDPNANFFETQKAFYKYFENRESSKGSGYKQFKRWEYRMQRRILPDGTIPPADQTFNNFNKYQQSFSGIKSLKNGSNWTELGPRVLINGGGYDGLGRINAIGFHPTDPDIIFIGTPEGGLWYSDDGGITWTTHTDDLPTLGVSSIKINFNNTDIMYIGTGDRIYGSRGMGVMKSTNAGINWEFAKTGMGNTTVNMMVMHETNPDIMIAATDNGIYKTTDGANTWILKTSSSGFTDIEYKPGDMATVYAVGNGKFYRSTDSGETWIRTGTGVLPSAGRFVLGVSAASNNKVYVACDAGDEFGGLFISENSGETFTIKSNSPNILSYGVDGNGSGSISWYCFCIAVAPDDPNIINIGGVNQWLSTDGGDSWTCTGHWTGSGSAQEVHADQHIIEYSATDGKCYIGNDGGIYVSANHGQSWTELSDGLGISQVYKIGQSATLRDKVVNGYQDNGTMTYMGNNGLSWLSTGGGDGMECLVDHSNAAYSYRASQYGPISRYINNSNGRGITGSIDETGEWVTPFCLHETDANTMFIGYKNIWRAKNVKESNTSMINWEQITNNLAGSNSRNINLVEHSPANTKLFYFARGDRTLFRTENIMGTPSWENLTSRMPNNNIPTDLEAHPYDENILYMTQSYRVYKSSDKGNSWENISGSLPNIPMNDIAFDLSSNEGLYVATDAGVYFKEGPGIDWVFYGTGLPANVSINEIEIYQDPESREGSRLRVGTFGRGLWESPLGAFNGILAPAGLNAESGNGIVSLSWKEPFYHDDVSGYNIYRNG
ncbi:WD40/YVTN/BNR-like repeat-containing protein, partial [Bacteroidota bacterium]